jgi:hypothetical protein
MAPETFESTLRHFQRRTPFRSFSVELLSGSRIQIDHPEALIYRGGVAVYIAFDGQLTIFDHEGVNALSDESLDPAST